VKYPTFKAVTGDIACMQLHTVSPVLDFFENECRCTSSSRFNESKAAG
jgi:hypothetical protein